MKNLLFFLILFIVSGCKSPEYLVKPAEFGHYVYGHYVEIKKKGEEYSRKGELIEVNDTELVVLDGSGSKVIRFAKGEISYVHVLVALTTDQPKRLFAWGIPLFFLPISHGGFAILTLPLTLVSVSLVLDDAGKGAYRVRYPKDLPWEEIHKFARFPQGIPETIPLESLKGMDTGERTGGVRVQKRGLQ
jgi:hypothetical protein